MSDNLYPQTSSSPRPEPPYRSEAGRVAQPNTSSYHLQGNDEFGSAYPSGSYPAEAPHSTQDTQPFLNASDASLQNTDAMPRSYETETAPPRSSAQRKTHKAPRKSGGGSAKTFFMGFLGALVACALCLGGFAIRNAGNAKASSPSTNIGTTDSSVIDAVDEGQTLAEAVAAKALPSVVAVYNYQKSSGSYGLGYGMGQGNGSAQSDELSTSGMGSGVVLNSDGYIITNYHVVENADKITITVDGEERDAEYVGGDASSDVAVVKVSNTEGLVAADIGNSDDLVIGEWVMTVGAPLGLEQSVATGVVSATNRSTIMSDSNSNMFGMTNSGSQQYTYYPNMIQTDAVINPGNSGGALVDADGKLIGINTMISSYSGDYAGVGFAIPINYAIGIAEDVISGKTPTHAMLGVSVQSVNSQVAKRYNLPVESGAYISAISPDSGAANSELEVGDIITAINDKSVASSTDVTLDVREHNVGDTVKVTVNRNGESKDINVTLGSDENAATSQDQNSQNQNGGQNGNGNGYGNGYGYGYGGDSSQIEELLKMFGL